MAVTFVDYEVLEYGLINNVKIFLKFRLNCNLLSPPYESLPINTPLCGHCIYLYGYILSVCV